MMALDPWPTPWLAGHRTDCPDCDGTGEAGECKPCRGTGIVGKTPEQIIAETIRQNRTSEAAAT